MGKIGSRDFVPDLVSILNRVDYTTRLYNSSLKALKTLDESADDLKLQAIAKKELWDFEAMEILEFLPY